MGLWDEAVQVNPVWSQGHLTVDEGQGQGAVTGEAGCEDGAGPQGKEGEQLLETDGSPQASREEHTQVTPCFVLF